MDVVGLLIVDVDVVAADIDERQLVFFHVVDPLAGVALVADGIDLEDLVAHGGKGVVEDFKLGGLFLAVVAVGVPEPEHDIFLREGVGGDPFVGVGRLVGVGHQQFLAHGADEGVTQVFDSLTLVGEVAFGGPGTMSGEVIVFHQVDEDLIPADVLGAAFIAGGDELEEIAEHGAVADDAVEDEVSVAGDGVGILIVEQAEEVVVHLVEELRGIDECVIGEVDVVPVMGAVVD